MNNQKKPDSVEIRRSEDERIDFEHVDWRNAIINLRGETTIKENMKECGICFREINTNHLIYTLTLETEGLEKREKSFCSTFCLKKWVNDLMD